MTFILSKAQVYVKNKFMAVDLMVADGLIVDISPFISIEKNAVVFDFNNFCIFPGLVDVHVHLREPGFFYKETIKSGTAAAARGGFTSVCAMPNLSPPPDSLGNLRPQLDLIRDTAVVGVYPYATITKGQKGLELANLEELAPFTIAFSDDGRGVQSPDIMREAMIRAKALNKLIVAHCEDDSLLTGGYIHDGEYARLHGHKGISSASEYKQVERDLELVRETGCGYHVCHVSTKESVELIRRAKREGLNVTCETAPHYLVLKDMDLQEHGRFKMNPPIRSEEDRQALLAGISDGSIDMIATDHAPHSNEEKSRGLAGSLMGVTGLETAFPILYTELVKSGIITLEKLIELLHTNPAKRFNIGGDIEIGLPADLTVFNTTESYSIDPQEFLSQGKHTPFEGRQVFGRCKMTMAKGRIVWTEK